MNNLRYGLNLLLAGVVLAVVTACASAPKKEEAPAPAAPQAAPEAAPAPEKQPEAAPAPAPAPQPEQVKEEKLTHYTVARGDNLWDIAGFRVIYGNPYEWPLIFKANVDQIKDADLIYPNQVLVIPRDSSTADIDAAIQHAKTRGAWQLGVVEQSDLDYLRAQGSLQAYDSKWGMKK